MPNCWKLLARQRQIPQEIPPMIRSFRFRMLDTVPSDEPTKLLAFVAAVSAEFLRPEMRISGISTTDPSRERTIVR